MGNNFWAFGEKWAGITPRGKRFVVDTKSQASKKAGTKSSTKKVPKKSSSGKKGGKKRMAPRKKAKGGRRGARIVGNVGFKGVAIGGALLAAAKYLVRSKAPQVGAYTTAVANVGAGLVGGQLFGTGKSLVQFGVIDGVSELLYDLVTPGGAYDLPGISAPAGGGGVRWNF